MLRTYRFRLWTNASQERELECTLETHRRLYNRALDGKMLCWDTARVDWNFVEQSRWLTIQRRQNEYLATINAKSAELTLRRLDRAFKAFFARVRRGDKPGYPRFKSRDRFNSFAFAFTKEGYGDGCQIKGGKLRIRNIGTIRVRWHRQLPPGRIRQVRIVLDNSRWFVCIEIETAELKPRRKTDHVGIDVGLKSFATTSHGEFLGDSRSLERALPELRRRQRALSRCRRGSNQRRKVKRGVLALHSKVSSVRRDMHHKVARSLVDRYGVIAAENLNVQGMLKNRRLARRIADAGWYSFIQILIGKAESAGVQVILVDPKNTSQQCSNCGEIVRKSLAVRVHRCECGCVLDRDVNAALNVLGRAGPGVAKVGIA